MVLASVSHKRPRSWSAQEDDWEWHAPLPAANTTTPNWAVFGSEGCRDAGSEENVGRCACRHSVSGFRCVDPVGNCVCSGCRTIFAWCLLRGIPIVCHSADAAASPRSPPTAAARTPPLALVARPLALEWPSLGLDPRELEMVRSAHR
jgi:hypothetical protein